MLCPKFGKSSEVSPKDLGKIWEERTSSNLNLPFPKEISKIKPVEFSKSTITRESLFSSSNIDTPITKYTLNKGIENTVDIHQIELLNYKGHIFNIIAPDYSYSITSKECHLFFNQFTLIFNTCCGFNQSKSDDFINELDLIDISYQKNKINIIEINNWKEKHNNEILKFLDLAEQSRSLISIGKKVDYNLKHYYLSIDNIRINVLARDVSISSDLSKTNPIYRELIKRINT